MIAPPVTHRGTVRASAQAKPAGTPDEAARIQAAVDTAVAEALAKVSTPADAALAAQQQAFDAMLQQRAEMNRETNAIREMGFEQAKREDEFMKEWIKLI